MENQFYDFFIYNADLDVSQLKLQESEVSEIKYASPYEIKIMEEIKSENDVYEGEELELKIIKDVLYRDRVIISKDTRVKAKVSIIISTGMNGIPASIIFEDFLLFLAYTSLKPS